MKWSHASRRRSLLLLASVVLASCAVDTSVGTAQPSETTTIRGTIEVSYEVIDNLGNVVGSQISDVSELRIVPDFVVIKKSSGGGFVLPAARLQQLRWNPQ